MTIDTYLDTLDTSANETTAPATSAARFDVGAILGRQLVTIEISKSDAALRASARPAISDGELPGDNLLNALRLADRLWLADRHSDAAGTAIANSAETVQGVELEPMVAHTVPVSGPVLDLLDALIVSMLDQPAPISCAADVVRGVHSLRPLTGEEIDRLFDAAVCRIVAIELGSAASSPAMSASPSTAALVSRLAEMNLRFAKAIMRSALGLEAMAGAAALKSWLLEAAQSFAPVLERPIEQFSMDVIPFGVPDHEVAVLSAAGKPLEAEEAWRKMAETAGIDVGIGPWGEARSVYTSDMFRSRLVEGERRTIHLGLDLFMPAGTKVFSPIDAVVHGIDIEREMLSYGCLITLLHRSESGVPFLTLWGHLAHEACDRLTIGEPLPAGGLVGFMGNHLENGGWAPHLHLQICLDTSLTPLEIIGVGEKDYMDIWSQLFPDAYGLAGNPLMSPMS